MKRILFVLVPAFFVLLFSGCSKDDPSPNPIPLVGDSLISEMYFIDQFGSSADSSAWLKFQYDNNNRLSAVQGYYYDAGQWEHETTSQYYYNGSDTFPQRSVTTGTGYISTRYFTFNSMGFLVKDSTVDTDGYWVEADREVAAGIEHRSTEAYLGVINHYYDTVQQVRFGSRITRETSLTYGDRNDYEYDNNPNPFHVIPEMKRMTLMFTDQEIQGDVNNMKRVVYSGMANDVATFTYAYNTGGLPGKFSVAYTATPGELYHYVLKYKARN